VLTGPPVLAMSTLTSDSSTIAGAFTAVSGEPDGALLDDPFARLFPARLLRVEGGFVGHMPAPAGPAIQRYGGSPWPWDRFDEGGGALRPPTADARGTRK
jgi:hypothetical protein